MSKLPMAPLLEVIFEIVGKSSKNLI